MWENKSRVSHIGLKVSSLQEAENVLTRPFRDQNIVILRVHIVHFFTGLSSIRFPHNQGPEKAIRPISIHVGVIKVRSRLRCSKLILKRGVTGNGTLSYLEKLFFISLNLKSR